MLLVVKAESSVILRLSNHADLPQYRRYVKALDAAN
jgi:hypothetical protein